MSTVSGTPARDDGLRVAAPGGAMPGSLATGDASAPVVSLRGLIVSYGSNQVLRTVDLDIVGGTITALLGANGAGKSTLIKVLSGANPRYSGEIRVRDAAVTLTSPAAARSLGIGTVHQKVVEGIVPGLTVAENLLLDDLAGGGPAGVGGGRRRSPWRSQRGTAIAARAALQVLGLDWSDRVLGRDARDLRVSDAQLVLLARALRTTPAVLILDEPTSALTSHEADRLFVVLRRLRAEGLAIVYVSHRFGEIEALANSVVVLRDGIVQSHSERPFAWSGILQDMLGTATELTHARTSAARGSTVVAAAQGVTVLPESAPLSIEFRGGEVLGVLGLIGAGKTELAALFAGLAAPAAGSLSLGGHPYAPARPGDALRAGVVLVPEDRARQGILSGWSVEQNLTLPFLSDLSRLGGLVRRREGERAAEVVAALDVVTESLQTPIDDLSGGNQQKVVVGRWLSAEPRLALLDEPFRGVDIGARRSIGVRLAALAATGSAAVVFSSDVDEILEVADRIVVLVAGEIVLDQYADAVDRDTIVGAFLGATGTRPSGTSGTPFGSSTDQEVTE